VTWLGVPILDWVLLLVVLGLGVEAYVTTRSPGDEDPSGPAADQQTDPANEDETTLKH